MSLYYIPPAGFRNSVQERAARCHVYFVEGAGLVKIGYANHPIDRFLSMLTGCPIPLSLLASSPGGPALENELHHRFADDRSHGEWFKKTPELEAVIALAPQQYGAEYRDQLASLARKAGHRDMMRHLAKVAADKARLATLSPEPHDAG